ncbi:MAG TPA: oligosaccharide flippase family protein [Vicinamibacterales bacterium]|nr:oligosaccharide flippase family protein [Vicinamibacterales bacterium]
MESAAPVVRLSAVRQAFHTIGVRTLTLVFRFALVVLITRTLSTADYGAYAIVSTIGAFGVFLSGLNLSTYVYRAVPGRSESEQLRIFKTTFLFETMLATVIVVAFLASGQLFAVLRYLNAEAYASAFTIGLIILVLLVATAELTSFFQAQARLERSNWVDFIGQAAWILPLLALRAAGVQMTLGRILGAQLAGGIGVLAYGAFHVGVRQWLRSSADWSILRSGLAFSIPLIIPTLGVNSVRLADRLILSHYGSVADVGVYSLAAVLVNTLYSFTAGIIATTFGPRIFAAHNRGDERSRDALQTYMIKIALIGFVLPYLALCFGARPLVTLLARPDYARAVGVVPILGLTSIVLIVGYPANFMLTLQNRVMLLAALDVAGMVVSLAANFLLIPRYSYFGAAVAGVVGVSTTAALQYVFSNMLARLRPDLIFSFREEWSVLRRAQARLIEMLA